METARNTKDKKAEEHNVILNVKSLTWQKLQNMKSLT